MSVSRVTTGKMKVQLIDPKRLEEPDVRITSAWDPEMLPMLKASIEADGIQQPLIVIREGEHLWIVDGKHRRDEALLKGLEQVPCVIQDGSMRQVMTRNLYMNRLRGGIKASEMIRVIKWLQDHEGMGIEQIEKETGLKRDYIEKIIQCTRAVAEVLDELDRERIGVGHAWEIARINDRDVQLRLLAQTLQYRLPIKDLHEVVESTLEILRQRSENPPEKGMPDPTAVPTIRCHGCELEWPLKKVVGVNLCISCYGLLQDEVRRRRKEGTIPPAEPASNPSNT